MSSGGAADITGTLPMADARYVKAKTCVWWDIENCQVPRLCDPYSIARNISKSLADMNYKGVVTISAYGDTTKINPTVQQALSSTGIALHHVPAGIKDASDKKILVDMLIWGYDNPPPANHLLISGDRDFSNALHQLSMRRYNILLAQPEKASQALVSAAKTVWLWTSLVVGDRPFEKLPNFHNTSTNSKSNTVTESNSIEYSSQPDDFNLKNNNNGNFYNSNKAKQISKTQSQPVISASSSNGNEDVSKQSIGSSDSSNLNQKNDLKHPNYMFVSTTADLGSNCITSSSNSNIITESNRILYSSQPGDINQKNNDNGNFDNHRKEEQILRTQSQPIISTSSSNGDEEGNKQSIGRSDSPDSDQRNDLTPEKVSQAFVSAAKTVWQWTSLVVGGRPVEKIPNLHDTLDNSISNNETQGCGISYPSQPDDLNQKSSNNGNLDNHSNAKQISKSQSQPIGSTSPSNGNEEGSKLSIGSSDSSNLDQKNDLRTPELCSKCIPKSQQLVDSGKSNAPCGPTFNYTPKIKPKMVKKIPSNVTISTTNGSGAQESTINEMTKVDKNITLSRPSALVVPESANPYVSTDPTSAQLGPDMASSNCMNELTQPRYAHDAKEGGNISNTFSSFSTKSSSQVLPEANSSNAPNNNANTMFTNNRNNGIVMKKNWRKKQNVCSQSCHQSMDLSGSNYNSSSSSSSGPTIRPNDYQGLQSIGSSDSSNINQNNDLNQPSHTCVLTAPDLDSSCITTNTNPTPCIPKSQKSVDFGSINASKISATVKFAIKKNRKNNHKQHQNQCSPSSFRNLSGSNYNHSSSSSTVPTTRPNNYQAVHSTMPGVSLPTPIPDISKLNISDIAKWTPTIDRAREQVESIRVWARLTNIPSLYQTQEGLDWIYSHMGKLVCFDEATERRDRLGYARALIEITPKKELPSTVPVFLSEHVTGYVQVSFLWKPPICSICCSFGHTITTCSATQPSSESEPLSSKPPLSPLCKPKAREWRVKSPVQPATKSAAPTSDCPPSASVHAQSPSVPSARDPSYHQSLDVSSDEEIEPIEVSDDDIEILDISDDDVEIMDISDDDL